MIKVLMLFFALVLAFIGWYIKKNQTKLEVLFSVDNRQTLKALSFSFFLLAIIGGFVGLFLPTRDMAMTYVAIVLVFSAIFAIRLSQKMTI